MVSVYDVHHSKLIAAVAKELKEKVEAPKFTVFAKTGKMKERSPQDIDWYYSRLAAVFRKFYVKGTITTNVLTILYGGKKNYGVEPEHFCKGSGAIARHCVQDLEKLGYLKKTDKGRTITQAGRTYLDKVAYTIIKSEKK
ncbi:MAG: 30S ribosomal protein S19e [Candidatus ainarchaeum sp.]|nr:30S ribosomal protein S19e [Candidatus ainarchaeum sp.]